MFHVKHPPTDDEWGEGGHIGNPLTGEVRICAGLCTTCIFRPGNLMNLKPGRVTGMVKGALADEGHITCHQTLGTPEPAMCAGYYQLPAAKARSMFLRLLHAGIGVIKWITPSKG